MSSDAQSVRGPLVKLVVFTVLTGLLGLVLASVIGNLGFRSEHTYTVAFADATGVVPGDEVRIAGVVVGDVKSVSLHGTVAHVRFTVERSVPVHDDVVVALRYRDLVGNRYLALQEQPGTVPAQDPRALIPLARTVPALDLTKLFDGFKPLFAVLNPTQINQLSLEVVQTLQGEGGSVGDLLASTASLTNDLADRDQVIGRVIDNLDVVLGTVDQRDTQLTALVRSFDQLTTGLAGDSGALDAAIPQVDQLLSATTGLLVGARQPVAADVVALGDLSKQLNDGVEPVDTLLRDLPVKLDYGLRAADYGSWFNFYVCGLDVKVTLMGQALQLAVPASVAAQEPGTVCTKDQR